MTWGWSVSIVIYLLGLYMAYSYYPQVISWDDDTKPGKAALIATVILWPVSELYTLVLESVLGEE